MTSHQLPAFPAAAFASKAVEWQQQAMSAAAAGHYDVALDCAEKALSLAPEHSQTAALVDLLKQKLTLDSNSDDGSVECEDAGDSCQSDDGDSTDNEASSSDGHASNSAGGSDEAVGAALSGSGSLATAQLTEQDRLAMVQGALQNLEVQQAAAAKQIDGIRMQPATAEQRQKRRALRSEISKGLEHLKQQMAEAGTDAGHAEANSSGAA